MNLVIDRGLPVIMILLVVAPGPAQHEGGEAEGGVRETRVLVEAHVALLRARMAAEAPLKTDWHIPD